MSLPIGLGPEVLGPEIRLDIERTGVGQTTDNSGVTSFADRVSDFAEGINDAQSTAQTAAQDFADGRNDDLHGTMIQMQQADIQLRLASNIRNRVIEAYREVLRMGA